MTTVTAPPRPSGHPRDVEDIYELSPLQRGMLLHSLHDGSSDMYVSQQTHTVDGPLDPDLLVRAWELASGAHAAMRTSFHWKGTDKPLQVVHRDPPLPVQRHDWSGLDRRTQRTKLDQLRTDDLVVGVDVTSPPLQRLNVVRMSDTRHSVIWTYHHLLMDGWSIAIFLNDVTAYYGHLALGGPVPPAPPPYHDYIGWLQRQDLDAAEGFWRAALPDFRPNRLLPLRPWDPQAGTGPVDRRIVGLPDELCRGLHDAAARHQVTVGTIVQAVWSIVLRRYTDRADVMFGCASSGRPGELAGVDRVVGVFANTLPVGVTIPDEGDLGSWLRELQTTYAAIRQYEYSPLADIKKWIGAAGTQLFDSLVVLENYPVTVEGGEGLAGQLSTRRHAFFDKTDVPLSLTVKTEPVGELHLLIHRNRFGEGFMDDVLARLHAVFAAMCMAERIEDLLAVAGPPAEPAASEPASAPASSEPAAAIETAQERAIAEAFAEVLGIDDVSAIGATANFFALGGDSFQAVRAVSRIDGASVAMLAAHPTVRALAQALGAAEADPGDGLLHQLSGPDEPAHTIVCIPVGGGSAVGYRPLALALPDDTAVIAVSLPGHEIGGDPELQSVEEIAQACAEAVLANVDGPVSVYGHSTGVALAVELTRRLEAAGRVPDRLFLAASFPFYDYGPIGRAVHALTERPDDMVPELRRLLAADGIDGSVSEDDMRVVARAASHDLATGRAYFSRRWGGGRGTPLDTPVTVIASTNDPATRRPTRRYRRWNRFAVAVECRTVGAAGHYFHQQHPERLAETITAALTSRNCHVRA